MQTLRVCGRKKLPFAEYSVVKDQMGGCAPQTPRLGRSWGPYAPLRSLAKSTPRSLTRRGPKARLRSLAKTGGLFRNTEVAKLITSALRPVRRLAQRSNDRSGRRRVKRLTKRLTHPPIIFQRARLRPPGFGAASRLNGAAKRIWLAKP
jgi:hypothetical protein